MKITRPLRGLRAAITLGAGLALATAAQAVTIQWQGVTTHPAFAEQITFDLRLLHDGVAVTGWWAINGVDLQYTDHFLYTDPSISDSAGPLVWGPNELTVTALDGTLLGRTNRFLQQDPSVPDGGATALLAGLGLFGVVAARRHLRLQK